ncbi:hypothetical protein Naga_100003g169 [Nannochloropsis gaditana]|uniref:Uncharacterized protein n=1 Tax=Nannochloropsis gaditana TaxID=72520 RepID=W7TVP1_9STRA|nr:hypothetical protein Naga_100003g169 [Nannochloropsis gaditana]
MSTTHKSYGAYRRPGYLRTLGAYRGVKKSYEYCRGLVGVRTLAPVVERVAEGTLSHIPLVKNLKDEHSADGFPVLHGIDSRLADLLNSFDEYLDNSVEDPTTVQGQALRAVTRSVHFFAGWTPVIGKSICRLMIEIDPDHMSLAPRLANHAAVEARDEGNRTPEPLAESQNGRESFDRDMDDVSVMTDETSEEITDRQNKKEGKAKRKEKRFLQNMGKGIKKVMNYPKTPVHDISDIVGDKPSAGGGLKMADAIKAVPSATAVNGDSEAVSDLKSSQTASRKFFNAGNTKRVESRSASSISST